MRILSNLLKIGLFMISGLFLSTTCKQMPSDAPAIQSHKIDVLVMGAGGVQMNHEILVTHSKKWSLDSIRCAEAPLRDFQTRALNKPQQGQLVQLNFTEMGRAPAIKNEPPPSPACSNTDSLCLYFSNELGRWLKICSIGEIKESQGSDYR